MSALRYTAGKPEFQLLEPYAMGELMDAKLTSESPNDNIETLKVYLHLFELCHDFDSYNVKLIAKVAHYALLELAGSDKEEHYNDAIRELVKVFTFGKEKYAAWNFLKGMDWSKCIGSLKRHLDAYEQGKMLDYDSDCEDCKKGSCKNHSNLHHLAHVAWNALCLTSYYKYAPQFDDRLHWFKKPFKKLWLDIDGVCADFEQYFLKYFDLPLHEPIDWNDYRFVENMKKVENDDNFWLNCPRLIDPATIAYPIAGYCTARACSDEVVHQWLKANNFPYAKVVNVKFNGSKVETLKAEKCEIFVDDSIQNFVELQSNNILCYLKTRPHNLKYNVGHFRIDDINEIFNFQTISNEFRND